MLPNSKAAVQSVPQSIPDGSELTRPLPSTSTSISLVRMRTRPSVCARSRS